MKPDQLRIFSSVMRAGNFAAAARELDLDPSAVSRSIANLESELGLTLFERSTRKFRPTEAAVVLLDGIDPLLDELAQSIARARDVVSRPGGRLRVSASLAFGCEVIAPMLKGFREQYPDIELELVLDDRAIDIAAEGLDLAVRLGAPPVGDWVRVRLSAFRYRVLASPQWIETHGLPQSPQELAKIDCVRFPYPGYVSRWRFRDAAGAISEVDVSGGLIVSSALGLKRCLVDGHGPGLLADWMSERERSNRQLVDLFPKLEVSASDFDTAAWILYPNRQYVPAKLRVFIDYLKEQFERGDKSFQQEER